jgi:hypothetical protein
MACSRYAAIPPYQTLLQPSEKYAYTPETVAIINCHADLSASNYRSSGSNRMCLVHGTMARTRTWYGAAERKERSRLRPLNQSSSGLFAPLLCDSHSHRLSTTTSTTAIPRHPFPSHPKEALQVRFTFISALCAVGIANTVSIPLHCPEVGRKKRSYPTKKPHRLAQTLP